MTKVYRDRSLILIFELNANSISKPQEKKGHTTKQKKRESQMVGMNRYTGRIIKLHDAIAKVVARQAVFVPLVVKETRAADAIGGALKYIAMANQFL